MLIMAYSVGHYRKKISLLPGSGQLFLGKDLPLPVPDTGNPGMHPL
jgi:hypothetical protein